jgi:hypothetical protein
MYWRKQIAIAVATGGIKRSLPVSLLRKMWPSIRNRISIRAEKDSDRISHQFLSNRNRRNNKLARICLFELKKGEPRLDIEDGNSKSTRIWPYYAVWILRSVTVAIERGLTQFLVPSILPTFGRFFVIAVLKQWRIKSGSVPTIPFSIEMV